MSKLTEEYILSKGFVRSENYLKYPTFELSVADIVYYISYLGWRGDYSLYIQYTDSSFETDEGRRYPFGAVNTKEEFDAFFKIMSYKENIYPKNGKYEQ